MDRKTIIVVVICLGVLFFGNSVIQKLFPPVPLPAGATNAVITATAPLTNPSVPAATIGAPTPALTTPMPKPVLVTSSEEKTLSFSNHEVRYTFSSHGGGIKSIELLQYPETVSRSRKQPAGTNNVAELNTSQAGPVLTIFGDDSVHDAGQFVLTQTATGMRAEKSLTNGLRITKDFVINSNFLVTATVRMENTANLPLTLSAQEWVIGTATPMDAADRGEAEGVIWYDGNKTEEKTRMWFDGGGFLFWSSPPKPEFRAGQSNVLWAAVHNQYFVLAAMPTNAAWQSFLVLWICHAPQAVGPASPTIRSRKDCRRLWSIRRPPWRPGRCSSGRSSSTLARKSIARWRASLRSSRTTWTW